MRKWLLLASLLLPVGCEARRTSRGHPRSAEPDELDFKAALLQRDHDLRRVEVSRVERAPGFFVGICDTERQWWGTFVCARWAEDHFEFAEPAGADAPTEQSILSIRGFAAADTRGSLVEVFGTTHMGNGNYYLYGWDGNALRLLLTTHAVDQHDDGRMFRGGKLSVEYVGVAGLRPAGIVFSGIVDESSDDNPPVIKSHPCRKAFWWDGQSGHYVEDVSQRMGFASLEE